MLLPVNFHSTQTSHPTHFFTLHGKRQASRKPQTANPTTPPQVGNDTGPAWKPQSNSLRLGPHLYP